MREYRSVDSIDDVGPCLVSGHPKEHELATKCWQKMRQFLWDNSWDAYIRAVKNK